MTIAFQAIARLLSDGSVDTYTHIHTTNNLEFVTGGCGEYPEKRNTHSMK